MASDRPFWRRAIDSAERAVAPGLEEFVQSERFADLAAVTARLRAEARRQAERATRRAWHFWNLPAGSDVKRLSEQVASLERRLRDLSKRLEDVGEETHGHAPPP